MQTLELFFTDYYFITVLTHTIHWTNVRVVNVTINLIKNAYNRDVL